MLYNQDTKTDFLEYKEENPSDYSTTDFAMFFEGTATTERKIKKDASTFNSDDISTLIRRTNINMRWGKKRIYEMIKGLVEYTDWIISNKRFSVTKNSYKTIRYEKVDKLVGSKTIDADISNRIIGKIAYDKYFDSLVNVRDKYVVEAMFSGIQGSYSYEIILGKIEDIDFDNLKMNLYTFVNGEVKYSRTVNISEKLVHLAKEANECNKYVSGPKKFSLVGDRIVKWRLPIEVEESAFKGRANNLVVALTKQLSSQKLVSDPKKVDIRLSGFIYHLRLISADLGLPMEESLNTDYGKELIKTYNYNKDFLNSIKSLLK